MNPSMNRQTNRQTNSGMNLLILPGGNVVTVYSEVFELAALGELLIRRAGRVEPDAAGRWWADLSGLSGPRLGPFDCRSVAVAAEEDWLQQRLSEFYPLPSSSTPRSLGCPSSSS